jgi:hypothetical protein
MALMAGDGTVSYSFLCVNDFAEFLVSAAFSGRQRVHAIGGPEAPGLYERIVGTALRIQRTAALVFRIAAPLVRPFSPARANLLCLNYIAAVEETRADPGGAAAFGSTLTSADAFLRRKCVLAATS